MVLPNFCWANSDADATERNISRRKLDLFNPNYVNAINNDINQEENFETNDAQMENQKNHGKEDQIKLKPSFTSSNGYYGYSMITTPATNNINNLIENHDKDNNMDLDNTNNIIGTQNCNEKNYISQLNLRKRYYVSDNDLVRNDNDEDNTKYSKRRRCKFDMSHDFNMDFDQLMEDDQNVKQHEQQENKIDANSMQIESGIESKLINDNFNSQNLSNDSNQPQHQQGQTVYRDMSRCMTSHMI